jgi:hypothetical protein
LINYSSNIGHEIKQKNPQKDEILKNQTQREKKYSNERIFLALIFCRCEFLYLIKSLTPIYILRIFKANEKEMEKKWI